MVLKSRQFLPRFIKKERLMRLKNYCSLSVCLLCVFFVQNVSAAFLDKAESLNSPPTTLVEDEWVDMFFMDANQRGYKYFNEIVGLVKKKDEVGVKVAIKKAKDSFLLALEQNPNSISYNALIKISLLEKDYKQVDQWLNKALSFDANNIDTRYLQAKLFIINNKFSDAKSILQNIKESNRHYKLAYFSLAEIAVKEKKYSVAEQYYRDLLLLGGQSAKVYTNSAGLFVVQNKPREAISILLQGYEYFKHNEDDAVNIAVELSKQYIANNLAEKALQFSRSVFESRVDNIRALDLYLDILVINKKEKEAEAILFDRVSKYKNDIDSRLKLIVLLSKKERNMSKVVGLFEEVVSLNNMLPKVYVAYARFLIENKAYKDASIIIGRAIKQFPNTGFTDILMAELSSAQGDMRGAAKLYVSAYNKSNDNNLLVKVVQSLTVTEQKTVAIKLLNEEIKTKGRAVARLLLAGIYLSDKDLDRAEDLYRQVLANNPRHYIALNDLAWLLSQKDKHKEALAYAEKAYFMDPTSDEIKDTYVTILNHLGFSKKAAEVMGK